MQVLGCLLLAVVVGLITGCGGAFRSDLTVETDQIRADPLFDVMPPGADVLEETYYTAGDRGFRIEKRWQNVTPSAYREVLRAATNQRTSFTSAKCLVGPDPEVAWTIMQGSKRSGDYSVAVDIKLRDEEMTISMGGLKDMQKMEQPENPRPWDELLAEAPALDSRTCDSAELQELAEHVR